MRSRCPERILSRVLLLAMAGALVTMTGCTRESRRFDDFGASAPSSEQRSPYEHNAYAISQGKRLFDWYNCSGCHAHGGGDIGPALIDADWIYGSSPEAIYATIVGGRPNGMPAFGDKVPRQQVWQLVAYVQSLTGQLSRDALSAPRCP